MLHLGQFILSATATTSPPRQGWTSGDSLANLVLLETLLFAALGIVFGLTTPSSGRRLRIGARKLAFATSGLLALIAAGAVLAWCDLFVGDWPRHALTWVPLIILLGGIVVQPILAWLIARDIDRPVTPP